VTGYFTVRMSLSPPGLTSSSTADLSALHAAREKNYLADAYNTLQKPIWLTEFAGSGTVAEQQTFLKYVIPWMEKQVRVVSVQLKSD
jgi:hypothetical protein